MTIAAAIVEFLSAYEGLEIETNHMGDGSDRYGLFKSPSRDKKEFNDSSCEITEYYQFFARQRSNSNIERKEADEWLEELTYWVDDYPFGDDYPALDKGRRIESISITGAPYPMEADDKKILYQMSLSITYTRQREDF